MIIYVCCFLVPAVPNLVWRCFFVPELYWSNMDRSPGVVVQVEILERLVIKGQPYACEPLERLHLYNFSRGRVHVGPIEIWYEKAAPNQVWHDE